VLKMLARNYRRPFDGFETTAAIVVKTLDDGISTLTISAWIDDTLIEDWLGYMNHYNEDDIFSAADDEMARHNMIIC